MARLTDYRLLLQRVLQTGQVSTGQDVALKDLRKTLELSELEHEVSFLFRRPLTTSLSWLASSRSERSDVGWIFASRLFGYCPQAIGFDSIQGYFD
jgi:hypothetical protein